MKLTIVSGRGSAPGADAVLAFVREEKKGGVPDGPLPEGAPGRLLAAWLKARRFSGAWGEAQFLPAGDASPGLLLAGLGPGDPPPVRAYEAATAAAFHAARDAGLRSIAVPLPDAAQARAIARGAEFGQYRVERFRERTRDQRPDPVASIRVFGDAASASGVRTALRDGLAEGTVLNEVRDLANLPGNEAPPAEIARQARRLARRYGLDCEVLGPSAIERLRLRALQAVARGSAHTPRVVVLRHRMDDRRHRRPIVLIGKTITFDSGGLSLKPGKGMGWMRYDKSGGMAVLGAMAVLARLRVPHPVIGVLVAAENMPDGNATRPGDIVRARNGRTVEILNTDAEGRLVLADALSLAADWKPCAIVDVATLTGAAIVALGHHAAAVLGSDETLIGELRTAGETTGERLWPLPLWPEYGRALRSRFADLANVGEGGAGTILGAAFLQSFAPEGVPWAHMDIAGTAWNENEPDRREPGATLFGARLLAEWVRCRATDGA